MKLDEIVSYFEELAPTAYQEEYDNAGLIVGDASMEVKAALLTLDVTPEVVLEAIDKGANLIISHHPIIFRGIKKFTGSSNVEKTVAAAIKNDIAIFAAHTNFDSMMGGVNLSIARKLGITNLEILQPINNGLFKLVTFVPVDSVEKVRDAMFKAGAGQIGGYDCCSFGSEGIGTFRAGDNTHPYVGQKGEMHKEPEVRVETILPKNILARVVEKMIEAHPYEEVAYDIYPLEIPYRQVGLGMVGNIEEPVASVDFLRQVKEVFGAGVVRYTALSRQVIKRVAFCGGSGASLIGKAIESGADIFITSDIKYHQFFDADGRIIIADIGHFESEQFTIELFYEYLLKKFPTFAVLKSRVNTNPINYL